MWRLLRHSRRWSPAVLRFACMWAKVALAAGQSITLEVIAIERTPRPQPGAFGPHATPIWKVTHAVINPITFEVVASRVAGSDLPGIVNQKQAIMTNGFSQGEAVLAMTPTPLQTGHR